MHPASRLNSPDIKKSRFGAHTLVIDSLDGFATTVAWCLSKQEKIQDAVTDLRRRKDTTKQHLLHST